YLNRKMKTSKFRFLPDPIPEINPPEDKNEQAQKIRFLHFGGLCNRKGTIRILDALLQSKEEGLKNKAIIFAGVVYPDIKTEFYHKIRLLENKIDITIYDQFCSYELLGECCAQADYILAPYENTSFSSGCIGYGALFDTTLVVPRHGLLGKLVFRNHLGVLINDFSIESLRDFLEAPVEYISDISRRKSYVSGNSASNFVERIFDDINS
ncbi:MAG: hypothetical protein Q8909_09790, partial [Bacteroidota bacterium]|nr:hypothetical protein [Bacteroidota bacterium]